MHSEWLAFEQYRIHVMELWPDGPRKQAGLSAARSAMESLTRTTSKESSFPLAAQTTRRPNLIVMPVRPCGGNDTLPPAVAASSLCTAREFHHGTGGRVIACEYSKVPRG